MKIGTDGVLLGAWANTVNNDSICDIGSGTGLIALMQAQKNSHAKILAVEIDENAAEEAFQNFQNSIWKIRLRVHCGDFLDYKLNESFDHFISNPPFYNAGQNASLSPRTLARHVDNLSIENLLFKAKSLGRLPHKVSLVLPANQLEQTESVSKVLGYFINRICFVKPNAHKAAHRILLELGTENLGCEKTELTIEISRHIYTPEYIALCQPFYLKMAGT